MRLCAASYEKSRSRARGESRSVRQRKAEPWHAA
jgi:hypothetical protein